MNNAALTNNEPAPGSIREDGDATRIYCGDTLWVCIGSSEPIKRRKVSKRAIAAIERAERRREERWFKTSKEPSVRSGARDYGFGVHAAGGE